MPEIIYNIAKNDNIWFASKSLLLMRDQINNKKYKSIPSSLPWGGVILTFLMFLFAIFKMYNKRI